MTTNRSIVINSVQPATLGLRHPLGVDLDLHLTMKKQDNSPVDPTLTQFVLLPRSRGGMFPYDMEAYDVANGVARVEVPGTNLTDVSGCSVEVYSRAPNDTPGDPPKPTGLLARGVIVFEGSGYSSQGPQGMINVPVVTGPPGPMGATGQRGSMWFTGSGDPTPLAPGLSNALDGDMYLDEANGNVWRLVGTSWVRGTF